MLRKMIALGLALGTGASSHALQCGALKDYATLGSATSSAVSTATSLIYLSKAKRIVREARQEMIYPTGQAVDGARVANGLERGDQLTVRLRLGQDEARQRYIDRLKGAIDSDNRSTLFWGAQAIEELAERRPTTASGVVSDAWLAGDSLMRANQDQQRLSEALDGGGPVPEVFVAETLSVSSPEQVENWVNNLQRDGRLIEGVEVVGSVAVRAAAAARGIALYGGAIAAVSLLVVAEERWSGAVSASLEKRFIAGVCR